MDARMSKEREERVAPESSQSGPRVVIRVIRVNRVRGGGKGEKEWSGHSRRWISQANMKVRKCALHVNMDIHIH